jgi:hypothetical protein
MLVAQGGGLGSILCFLLSLSRVSMRLIVAELSPVVSAQPGPACDIPHLTELCESPRRLFAF